jgi:hypothetical protein
MNKNYKIVPVLVTASTLIFVPTGKAIGCGEICEIPHHPIERQYSSNQQDATGVFVSSLASGSTVTISYTTDRTGGHK